MPGASSFGGGPPGGAWTWRRFMRATRLIVLRLTGFGQTGPYARRPGFARISQNTPMLLVT